MTAFARRLAGHVTRGFVMIWVVTTFTFFVIVNMPGDPAKAMYEELILQGVSPESAAAQAESVNRIRPTGSAWDQYLDYMGSLLKLDLGKSLGNQTPVSDLLLNDIKWTFLPFMVGIVLSFILGIGLGIYAAVKRSGKLGDFLALSGAVIHGIPVFIIALIFGSTLLTVLPGWELGTVSIEYEPGFNGQYIGSLAQHALLPILTYIFVSYGGWLLAMRSSVVTTLGDDFILAAELRGMKRMTVYRYIGRNAILPLFTVFALSIATIFGGSVFIESVFNYSGLGLRLLQAQANRDVAVMAGALLLVTVAVIVMNILADIFYSFIDPRIRRGGEA